MANVDDVATCPADTKRRSMTVTAHLVTPSTASMKARDVTTFSLCFLAALVEGFDLQSAGVAAPKFGPAYGLDPAMLGWVFSSNTFGLFLGAAIGGAVSDRVGRRAVLIASMFLFGVFSLGTAFAPSAQIFIAMRFLTGLGLGGAMPNLVAMTAETGSPENRALKVTLISAGMPLGGALAGVLALLGASLDWKIIFWVGGVSPILVGAAMLFLLQESTVFVHSKSQSTAQREGSIRALFGNGRAIPTLLLWAGFFFTLTVLYLILNWLPSLLIGKGFERPDATLGTLLFSVGGAVGAVVLGLLMKRLGWRIIVILSYAGMAASVFAMASIGHEIGLMLGAAFMIGFFVIGAQFLLYGLAPTMYPALVRGTGVGWGVAVGRLGSIVGPAVAAGILASGRGASDVMLAMLPVIAIAFLAIVVLTWRSSATESAS